MKESIVVLVFMFFVSSCTSHVTEHNRYLKIKSLMAQEGYSRAVNEIFSLEKEYPDSKYLCELWGIQIAYFKKKNSVDSFISDTEVKRKKRCSNL